MASVNQDSWNVSQTEIEHIAGISTAPVVESKEQKVKKLDDFRQNNKMPVINSTNIAVANSEGIVVKDPKQELIDTAVKSGVTINNNYSTTQAPVEQKQDETQGFYKAWSKEQLEEVEFDPVTKGEIRSCKARIGMFTAIGSILLIACTFWLCLYFLPDTTPGFHGIVPDKIIVHPVFPIFFGIVGLGAIVWAFTRAVNLTKSIQRLKISIRNGEKIIIPSFISSHYLGMTRMSIWVNCVAWWVYALDIVAIGVLWGLTAALPKNKIVPACEIGKIVCYAIAGGMFALQMFIWLSNIYHCSKISGYYNDPTLDERADMTKKATKKACLLTSLVVLILLIFIPWIAYNALRKKTPFRLPMVGRGNK